MIDIDLEIIKAKHRIKELKKIKKMEKKHHKVMKTIYKQPPSSVLEYWFNTIVECFKDFVSKKRG